MRHVRNKKRKRYITEGIKQLNQEKIRTSREKETYKYLRILEADSVHKALHPRDDIHRIDVSRTKGGRGFASTEDSVDASIQRLEGYIENPGGRLITATRNNTENTRISRTEISRKQK